MVKMTRMVMDRAMVTQVAGCTEWHQTYIWVSMVLGVLWVDHATARTHTPIAIRWPIGMSWPKVLNVVHGIAPGDWLTLLLHLVGLDEFVDCDIIEGVWQVMTMGMVPMWWGLTPELVMVVLRAVLLS